MLRAFVLLVLTFSLSVWGQEAALSDSVTAFSSVNAALDSTANASSATVAMPGEGNAPSVAALGVSSSREVSGPSLQPTLLRVSSPTPAPPAILKTTSDLPVRPSAKQQRIWWALTMAQHSAATFDAWSTRKSISSGNGYERNPLMKPFANSAAIYPVIQVAPLGLDYVSKRMMRSRHGFFRKTWWVPQTLATAGFAWSGVHNLRVANGK